MFDKDRQRVTEELESVVAELRTEGVLPDEVSVHRPLKFCVSQNLVYYLSTVLSAPRLPVLPVLAVPHISHSEPNSLKRLACGVFKQALRDCGFLRSARIDKKLQRDAIHFLTNGGEAFRFWCHALNQDPNIVRSELKKRLSGS